MTPRNSFPAMLSGIAAPLSQTIMRQRFEPDVPPRSRYRVRSGAFSPRCRSGCRRHNRTAQRECSLPAIRPALASVSPDTGCAAASCPTMHSSASCPESCGCCGCCSLIKVASMRWESSGSCCCSNCCARCSRLCAMAVSENSDCSMFFRSWVRRDPVSYTACNRVMSRRVCSRCFDW